MFFLVSDQGALIREWYIASNADVYWWVILWDRNG
jgi:hypothetical protein